MATTDTTVTHAAINSSVINCRLVFDCGHQRRMAFRAINAKNNPAPSPANATPILTLISKFSLWIWEFSLSHC